VKRYETRLIIVSVVLAVLLLVVVGRLFTIQIVEGKKYAGKSRSQVQQRRPLPAKRGEILDRRGRQLAASVPGRMALSSDMVGVENGGQVVLQRVYPMRDVAGSLLGYVGRGGYGFSGIEYDYDHYLRGEDGWEMAHREAHDRHGRQRTYSMPGLSRKEARDGNDVYLTIDLNLQKIVQSVLKQVVEERKARGAMAIVMDPHTGRILAMANEPAFNPNVPLSFSLEDRRNKSISEVYEHGSTFKVITAAVALQERMLSETDTVDGGNGVFEIHGQQILDDNPQGRITFSRALAVSSNVVFARVANDFTDELFYRYSRDFGFGTRTGAFVCDEEAGILHRPRSSLWSGRTRVTMAYGYDVSPTFLQMIMAYAAVANGGVLLTPIISERIVSKNGTVVQSAEVRPVRRVISAETAARLRRMMREVVESGTGGNAAVSGISVAGKTGTARKPEGGGYSRTKHWMSFIGFLPADKPELLCGIVIDEPMVGSGARPTAGRVAAPAFSKIMSQAIAHPELEFLKRTTVARDSAANRPIRVPNMAGRTRETASVQLDSMKIAFSFVGDGDVIRHQSPAAGSFMANRPGGVILYTDEWEIKADSTARIVPNGVGKDLRDAFNLFNASGISVYAVGSGVVKRQSIAPGEMITSSAVCTLYGGARKR
jgi:cell division protein FtsI/penicillin-binding protein 2